MRKTTQQQSHTFVVANDDIAQLHLHASVVVKNNHKILALAKDGKELIELAIKHKPDFILSDLIMPKKHGIEACIQIKNVLPKTKCIISSSYHDISLFYKTAFYKLNGFLFNDITAHKLNICMQQINLHNQFYIDLTYRKDFFMAVKKIIPEIRKLTKHLDLSEITELSDLSALSENSELALLNNGAVTYDAVIHNGKSIKINDRHILLVSAIYHCLQRREIADIMHIAEHSVDTTIKRLKQSLSIDDRIKLIRLFQDWGYIRTKIN